MDTTTPRIAAVRALPDRCIEITWKNGEIQTIDLTGWIGSADDPIGQLRDPEVFTRAGVGLYGSVVTWDEDEGDLAIDAVHLEMIGEEQRPFGADEAASWQQSVGLSNREAAQLLGIVPSTWNAYKAGSAKPPASVAIACRAALRDPVIVHAHFRPARSVGRPRRAG